MQFSPCAGDTAVFKKIASPWQAKNRSCSRGLMTGGHLCAVSNVLMSLGKRWYCGQAVTQERCWLMRDGH